MKFKEKLNLTVKLVEIFILIQRIPILILDFNLNTFIIDLKTNDLYVIDLGA